MGRPKHKIPSSIRSFTALARCRPYAAPRRGALTEAVLYLPVVYCTSSLTENLSYILVPHPDNVDPPAVRGSRGNMNGRRSRVGVRRGALWKCTVSRVSWPSPVMIRGPQALLKQGGWSALLLEPCVHGREARIRGTPCVAVNIN